MLKAAIFDMNGVIIDDERIHQESWRQICKKYNFHLTEDEFKHNIFGRTEADTFEYLFHRQLTPEELAKFSDERVKTAIDIFKPQLTPTIGLLNLLEELTKQNISVAIATSARWPYTNFILDGLNIRKYFKEIVTAEDIKKGKPDPEIYLKTAEKLGVDPHDCVVFEDTLSGIKSAHSAGMKVIAITTTHKAEELSSADAIIPSFNDINANFLRKL